MAILVTGGAGFIGTHTCIELINAGYEPIVVDNYYNASPKALERVEEIVGKKVKFYECDVRDKKKLDSVFKENKIDAVIHFAGLKAVGESCHKPLEYYDNNIGGTLALCEVMRDNGCKKNRIFLLRYRLRYEQCFAAHGGYENRRYNQSLRYHKVYDRDNPRGSL